MLMSIFHAGGARYGLEASAIVEIIPAAALRPIPRMPSDVAGLLNYHGTIVPVLDLTELVAGVRTRSRMSSRIVIVNFQGADGTNHPLGLLAEGVTETIQCSEREFQSTGIRTPGARFSGDVLIHPGGTVQKVEIRELLPAEIQQRLFTAAAEANA